MRILVVEDEREIANFLKKGLETECFVVDAVYDGETGSKMACENHYDAIVLDNIMPGKHGIDVCKDVRKSGSNVPIIMLSVKSEVDTKVKLLNAGADDYLTKPFSFDELLARLRALLRRPKQIKNELLEIDNLQLDKKKFKVTRADKEIYLTKKEFMLLEYLMKNAGHVLSRGMILEHVWDANADPFSNTIESHVVSLRRKIDMEGERKLIHTVNGRGYKIDPE
jgi:DNA-binding response OmpR family regulator